MKNSYGKNISHLWGIPYKMHLWESQVYKNLRIEMAQEEQIQTGQFISSSYYNITILLKCKMLLLWLSSNFDYTQPSVPFSHLQHFCNRTIISKNKWRSFLHAPKPPGTRTRASLNSGCSRFPSWRFLMILPEYCHRKHCKAIQLYWVSGYAYHLL